MSEAPTELWADWDYNANDGVCGVHTHKKYASGYEPDFPPIRYVRADRIEELEADLAKAMAAAIDAGASLAAAISLLDRGGKNAAPSNKMFAQMLADYSNALDRTRTTLEELKGKADE